MTFFWLENVTHNVFLMINRLSTNQVSGRNLVCFLFGKSLVLFAENLGCHGSEVCHAFFR